MSNTTARRVLIWPDERGLSFPQHSDDPHGTHMLVEVENILKAQRRTDDLRKSCQVLNQPELERIICSARDELMRELGLEEVDGE